MGRWGRLIKTMELSKRLKTCMTNKASTVPYRNSRREFCNQLVYMGYDIVDPRPDSSLGLKHPGNKLMKSFWVWRLRSSWPFDLSIYNGQLQTSTRFSKCIFKWRYSIPAKFSQVMINKYTRSASLRCF